MDDARETGHFDSASGHYVEDKFKMLQRDAWLDEVNEKYAHGLQKKLAAQQAQNEMEEDEDQTPPEEHLYVPVCPGVRARGLQRTQCARAICDVSFCLCVYTRRERRRPFLVQYRSVSGSRAVSLSQWV